MTERRQDDYNGPRPEAHVVELLAQWDIHLNENGYFNREDLEKVLALLRGAPTN